MKIIKAAVIILALFVSQLAHAQQKDTLSFGPQWDREIKVPQFKGNVLVLRTIEYAGQFDPTLTVSDGSADTFSLPLKFIGNLHEAYYTKVMATVLNQLKKQGYKIVTSSSGGSGDSNWTMLVTAYILQRD